MGLQRKKIGIITFHNSYNCGSMMESFAIQTIVKRRYGDVEIVDFSNAGQSELYSVFFKNNSIKNIIKNIVLFRHRKKIRINNGKYEAFKKRTFILGSRAGDMSQLNDDKYSTVIAGSDQIWNITIKDSDDAYFLPWVSNAKKIAYAPSFGAKDIMKNTSDTDKYRKMINDFDYLSIREENGKKWIKNLCDKDVEVLLDPTLLLERGDYVGLEDKHINVKEKYLFFYSPSFDRNICKFVKKIAEKYDLKVITWSAKPYYIKHIKQFGFELPEYEDPSVYLSLIKNAELILTTSYHGTIFSTIYRKKFFTIKNGDMYGDDDRVMTLLNQLKLTNRLVEYKYDEGFDYMRDVDYTEYDNSLKKLQKKSLVFLDKSIGEKKDEERK